MSFHNQIPHNNVDQLSAGLAGCQLEVQLNKLKFATHSKTFNGLDAREILVCDYDSEIN